MSFRHRLKLFDDSSRHLDRFGWLLFFTLLAIAALALVDISDPGASLRATVASVIATLLVGVTLLLAMRASGLSRRLLRIADVLVVLVVVVIVAFSLAGTSTGLVTVTAVEDSSHPFLLLALSVLTPLFVVRRLLCHRTVTTGTVYGAISAFLLIPIAFCYGFLAIDTVQTTPFFGQPEPSTSFMYFSLSCVTTVGFGDLTAVTPLARLAATAEALTGQVYLVTFVAMMVGLLAQTWALSRAAQAEDEAEGDA